MLIDRKSWESHLSTKHWISKTVYFDKSTTDGFKEQHLCQQQRCVLQRLEIGRFLICIIGHYIFYDVMWCVKSVGNFWEYEGLTNDI